MSRTVVAARGLTIVGPGVTREEVTRGLTRARGLLGEGDVAELRLEGRMIRPLLAASVRVAGAQRWQVSDDAFWVAALAVQLVHEASLVHDDVVDGATTRRGRESAHAAQGVAGALLYGDRLLTAGLRAGVTTGSPLFAQVLARATDRTVAGERAQRASKGRAIRLDEYRTVVSAKTGELLGAAMAAAPSLAGDEKATRELLELGRGLGLVYQMADDLLDCCPQTDRGKPTLGDLREGRWTWILAELPGFDFSQSPELVARRLAERRAGRAPLERAAVRWRRDLDAWRSSCARIIGPLEPVESLLGEWQRTIDEAVTRECSRRSERIDTLALRQLDARTRDAGIARHSRTFSLATRFAPAPTRARIRDMYAWCRATDDLVDALPPSEAAPLLDRWVQLAIAAYDGTRTGIDVVDRALGTAAGEGVPLSYALELIEGMRMDLQARSYASVDELALYTRRVAGVVGLWLTELHGLRDPWALERAAALGHAMQLTNIVRDVGEDLGRGRVYLPASLVTQHGIMPQQAATLARESAPLPRSWASLLEDVMRQAETSYELAWEAIPALPTGLARPVAIASEAYRGIHEAVRRNHYDVFTRRAHTSASTKARLVARGVFRLGAETRRYRRHVAIEALS